VIIIIALILLLIIVLILIFYLHHYNKMIMEEETIQNGKYLRVIFHPAFAETLSKESLSPSRRRGGAAFAAQNQQPVSVISLRNLVSVVIPLDLRCLETFLLLIRMGRGFWKYGDWIGLYRSHVDPDEQSDDEEEDVGEKQSERLLHAYDADCMDRYYPVTANIASNSQYKGCVYWRALFAPDNPNECYQFRYFRQDSQLPVFVTSSFRPLPKLQRVRELGPPMAPSSVAFPAPSIQCHQLMRNVGVGRHRHPVRFRLPVEPHLSMLNQMFKLGFEFDQSFTPQKGDWIGLFESREQDAFYGDRWYEVSRTAIQRGYMYWEDFRSPWKPGSYEFRYFHGLDETLVARQQFTIPDGPQNASTQQNSQSIRIHASTKAIFGKDYRVVIDMSDQSQYMNGDSLVLKKKGSGSDMVAKKLNEQRRRQGWLVWEAEFAPMDRGAYNFVYQRCTGEEVSRSETYYVPLKESVLPHMLIGCLDPQSSVTKLIPGMQKKDRSEQNSPVTCNLFDRNVISLISEFVW
jgi:hypothetical protein